MPPSGAVRQLLRQLDLPTNASKAQIRAAYLRKVKVLHPDVAGKSAEESFCQLKEEYEHAMEEMKQGAHGHGHGQRHARHAHDFHAAHAPHHYSHRHGHGHHRRHWDPNPSKPWKSTTQSGWAADMSITQRLGIMSLSAFGVFAVAVYMFSDSAHYAVAPPRHFQDGRTGGAEASQLPRTPPEKVSDYYKSRTAKSSVRVRGGDYVSPPEASNSQEKREGTQSTASLAESQSPAAATSSTPKEPAGTQPVPMHKLQ